MDSYISFKLRPIDSWKFGEILIGGAVKHHAVKSVFNGFQAGACVVPGTGRQDAKFGVDSLSGVDQVMVPFDASATVSVSETAGAVEGISGQLIAEFFGDAFCQHVSWVYRGT